MAFSRARFRGDGGLGPLRVNFKAFWRSPEPDFEIMCTWASRDRLEVSRARFRGDGGIGPLRIDFETIWRSPGDLGVRGVDFEPFWRSPGPDFEADLGL